MWASNDASKENSDGITKKLTKNIIEIVEHIFHHIRISSPNNNIEDDKVSEITNSTSKIQPSKYEP